MRQWYITPIFQTSVYGVFGAEASQNAGVMKHELHDTTWAGKPGWLRHLILLMVGVFSNDSLRIVTDIDMKIAVATEDNEPSSRISTQGARALFFLIFDADGDLNEILENPYADHAARVGPDVAKMLVSFQVTKVVAGRFGPRFKQVLQENHTECIERTGFASQVVKELVE